jgi:four helix bundle protein
LFISLQRGCLKCLDGLKGLFVLGLVKKKLKTMEHKIFSFEKLVVWEESRELNKKVYHLTSVFPEVEKYGLINQLRRASISISLNIAEGASRPSGKDQAKSYKDAYGSLMEVMAGFICALDLEFINQEIIDNEIRPVISKIGFKLNSLRNKALE